jgi:hypothetical protein
MKAPEFGRSKTFWAGVAAFAVACNAAVIGGLLLRSKRHADARTTFSAYFRCRPEDVAIEVEPRDGLGSAAERDEYLRTQEAGVRAELREDVVVSLLPYRAVSKRKWFSADRAPKGILIIPGVTKADWVSDNFLVIHYSSAGASQAEQTVLLAPRTWLQKDL